MPIDLTSGDPIADRRADYARGYAEAGNFAAAADLMRQALERAPGWAAGWNALAGHLDAAGARDQAIEALRRAAALDLDDALGAAARLAALGAAPVPDALPSAFVRTLFDQYAPRFEAQLRDRLAYRAPELLLGALRTAAPSRRFAAALDLGCGTGLMGERLRPFCDRLEGLDLSTAMLARAAAKGCYDALHEADLLAFTSTEGGFDLIAAADVLNYLGDLAPVLARAATWLRLAGLLAFTVEAHEGTTPFVLRDTMRYAHSGDAVAGLLADAGFALLSRTAATLREDRGEGVAGWIFVAERRSAPLLPSREKVPAEG